jgi:eukaryotic-like serine/threonine-protein kinase
MPAATAPAPGTILAGKFRVVRTLGIGGMGSVVEAEHLELGQRVAVKLLSEASQQSPEAVTRFFREARLASQLFSEHVARVYDVGRTERGEPFIVMELLTGQDFDAIIQRRAPMAVAEAVSLLLHALCGVAAAHAAGLVHRDLKPANLFLSSRRDGSTRVVVLDFGITKAPAAIDALTVTSSVFGTPQYMSPEQVMSAKNVDARCDQHAMAMVLYEMLAGQPPYLGDSPTALAVLIATEPPVSLCARRPDIPPALDSAVRRALAKRPEDRFADVAALAQALAPFGGRDAATAAQAVRMALSGAHLPMAPASAPRSATPDALPAAPPSTDPATPNVAVTPALASLPAHRAASGAHPGRVLVAPPPEPRAAAPGASAPGHDPRVAQPSQLGAQGTATAAPTTGRLRRKHSSVAAWLAAAAASMAVVAGLSFVAWRARAVHADTPPATAQASPAVPATRPDDSAQPAAPAPPEAPAASGAPSAAEAAAPKASATASGAQASSAAASSAKPRASSTIQPRRPPSPPGEFLPAYGP